MPLTKEEIRRLFNEVRENHAKLDACKGHRFGPRQEDRCHVCSECGAKMDFLWVLAYKRGVEHGRKQSADDGYRVRRAVGQASILVVVDERGETIHAFEDPRWGQAKHDGTPGEPQQ